MSIIEQLLAVARAYQDVRAKQVKYFKTRNRDDLIASKEAERSLDVLAAAAIAAAEETTQ